MSNDPKEFWITLNDDDSLTHIVLFEKLDDRPQLRVVDATSFDQMRAEKEHLLKCYKVSCDDYAQLRAELDRIKAEWFKSENDYLTAKADLALAIEAMEMGAFHHQACDANWYSEEVDEEKVRAGIPDHRKEKPCTCARKKIDEALSKLRSTNV